MILDDIVKAKKIRLEEQIKHISLEDMKKEALKSNRVSVSFYEALKKKYETEEPKHFLLLVNLKRHRQVMGIWQVKLI